MASIETPYISAEDDLRNGMPICLSLHANPWCRCHQQFDLLKPVGTMPTPPALLAIDNLFQRFLSDLRTAQREVELGAFPLFAIVSQKIKNRWAHEFAEQGYVVNVLTNENCWPKEVYIRLERASALLKDAAEPNFPEEQRFWIIPFFRKDLEPPIRYGASSNQSHEKPFPLRNLDSILYFQVYDDACKFLRNHFESFQFFVNGYWLAGLLCLLLVGNGTVHGFHISATTYFLLMISWLMVYYLALPIILESVLPFRIRKKLPEWQESLRLSGFSIAYQQDPSSWLRTGYIQISRVD